MVLPPYPRVARHAATAVVVTRCILTASSYMHQPTCPLAPITQVSTRAHASHSLPSFTHLRIDLIWMQLKNYEGRTAADYLRVHNTWRYVNTHACERTAIHSRCGGWCCLTVVRTSSPCGYISRHGLLTCVYANTHACNNECIAIKHGLH